MTRLPKEVFEWPTSFGADVKFDAVTSQHSFAEFDYDLAIWYNTDFSKMSADVYREQMGELAPGADPIDTRVRMALLGMDGEDWYERIAARVPFSEFRCAEYLEYALKHILLVDGSTRPQEFVMYDSKRGVWAHEGVALSNGQSVGSAVDEVINKFGKALGRAADVLLELANICAPDPGPKPGANANQALKNAWHEANTKRERALKRAETAKKMARSIFTGKYAPIKNLLKSRLSVDTTSWDSETRWLVLSDGVIDLEQLYSEGQSRLRPFSPHYMMTMALEVGLGDPSRNAGDSEWDKGVAKVIPDIQVRRYLQKRFGAALLGRPGVCGKSMVWQFGVGDTAKSTIQECIAGSRGVFAPYSITSSSTALTKTGERTGATDRFMAYARGKKFAVMSELDDGEHLSQGKLKNMIGGESVEGTAKYSNAVSYFFTATIFMASNHPPLFPPGDTAAATRIHVVPFTHKLWIRSKNPEEWEAAGPEHRADESWTHRVLDSAQERSAILRWVLDGLVTFGREGIGELPAAMREASEEFAADADPVAKIVRSLLGEEPGYEDTPSLRILTDKEWDEYGFKESDGVPVKDVEYLIEIRAFELGVVKAGETLSNKWMNSAKRMIHERGGNRKKVKIPGSNTTTFAYSRMRLAGSNWALAQRDH